MQPVFMILGQSAATAAQLALRDGTDVQTDRYTKFRKFLHKDGSFLDMDTDRHPAADATGI